MTAARFLDLFPLAGGECWLKSDGKVGLRASPVVLDAIAPQLAAIGRTALASELARSERLARERLASRRQAKGAA